MKGHALESLWEIELCQTAHAQLLDLREALRLVPVPNDGQLVPAPIGF